MSMDMLALISKAQFNSHWSSAALGARLGMNCYDSTSKQLRPLEEGGALFLVTVREPGEQLWLVGILEAPVFDGERWAADRGAVLVTNITHLRGELRFTTGKGISPKAGALGRSLQTPRRLTAEDVAMLRQVTKKKVTKKKAGEVAPGLPPPPRPLPARAGVLLEQIIADPDDQDLRRVYADLLLEHGDPQGEQIQLACALEQMAVDDPHRAETRETVASQQGRHGLIWSRALRQVGPFNQSSEAGVPFSFSRGFPEVLHGAADEIVPQLERAARAAPIRALDLAFDEDDLEALAATPTLAQIRSLVVRSEDELSPASVIALLTSPHLRRLEHLELQCRLTVELAAALARCEALAGCRELTLADDAYDEIDAEGQLIERAGLGPEGLSLLCQSKGLCRLEHLTLDHARVGPDGIAALDALVGLRRLSIVHDKLGLRGARALAATTGLGGLEELVLKSCGLNAKGLALLAQAPGFAGLRRLELPGPGNGLGQGLEALLGALALPRLEALGLGQDQIREPGARLLAASNKLKRIVELDVSGCGLKDAGIEALASARMPRLRTLQLASNGIEASGMEALAQGTLLASVRDLNLAGNKFHNAGGEVLAASPHLATLERLRLHYNWLGVGGLKTLLAATPSLVRLECGENNYTNAPGQVVASGALPYLRHLRAWQHNGPTITKLALSPAGNRLEKLVLDGSSTITDEGAEALARASNLGSLHLSFPSASPEGMAALRGRFGPFLSVWSSPRKWNAHPGPP